ncbi:MAG: FHA domain-containing serine/threonine-protein kinase [Sumerlaeia bacterium]
MAFAVTHHNRQGEPVTVVYDQTEVTLGRSRGNDFVIDSNHYPAVSRNHARFVLQDGRATVWDLGSTSGVLLNKKAIKESAPLKQGAEIRLDALKMRVHWRPEGSTGEGDQLPWGFPLALWRDFPSRFQRFERIGAGAYGEVWRAFCRPDGSTVAVKVLLREDPRGGTDTNAMMRSRQDVMDSRSVIERFHREADVTQRLVASGAPNIVPVMEAGGDPETGLLYMIMEYIEGQSLGSLAAAEHPIPQRRVCRFLHHIAQALEAAHAFEWRNDFTQSDLKGIIHRDITPANVLIRKSDDRALLCDFGIAAIQEGGLRLTQPELQVTALRYTPPEALIDDIISPFQDLWALAVLGYIVLSGGVPPYVGERPTDLLQGIRHRGPQPLGRYRKDLDPELIALLRQGLHSERAERPQSATEWKERLAPFADLS